MDYYRAEHAYGNVTTSYGSSVTLEEVLNMFPWGKAVLKEMDTVHIRYVVTYEVNWDAELVISGDPDELFELWWSINNLKKGV